MRPSIILRRNERLDKTVRYPVQGKPGNTRNVKQRDVIQHEAQALANALLGKTDMPRVLEIKQLWANESSAASEAPEESDEEELAGASESPN